MNDLSKLKGVGLTTIKALEDLNIYNLNDLIMYFPFRHNIIEKTDLSDLSDKQDVIVDGVCESIPTVFFFSRNKNKMTFKLNTGDKLLNVSIFNRAFLKERIKIGSTINIIGKYDKKTNSVVASSLNFGKITRTYIEPVYHASFKINSKRIEKLILPLLDDINIKETLPNYLIQKNNFLSYNDAIKYVHNPDTKRNLDRAIERLKYGEIFDYLLKVNALKSARKKDFGIKRNVSFKEVEKMISSLPFELTEGQMTSVKEIFEDLNSPSKMNRLLQGDVGSGKTIVAFIAIYINYLSGYQSALMAPTEILAQQHLINALKILNINVALLTGKTKAKEKKEILKKLSLGEIDLIIGTHALISDDVIYKNLGLVITDEQHRFGVNQRGNLRNKGKMPDVLYMSATPIPRTYALTLYGDMDISSIKTMPKGRKDVKTFVKKNSEIKDVLYMMLDEIKKGHQIYVVAPLIEESEKISLENVNELTSKMERAFSKVCKIGTLHGKMSDDEKTTIMNSFKKNEIKILISTTVIEVGVDVPNATMIVIFDAFRFGLSALHQLRGRVGRNSLDSYCVLVSDKDTKRLNVLEKYNDGFKISKEDFLLRGSGDIFGVSQSGDMCFNLASVKKDYQLLVNVKEDIDDFHKNKKEEYDRIINNYNVKNLD